MFTRFLLTIFVTAFFAFGQEQDSIVISEEASDTIVNETHDFVGADIIRPLKTEPQNETKPEVSIEKVREKVKNPRLVIISAIGMMLFVGLAMASVSSINPD